MKVTLIRPPRLFKRFNKALKPAPPLGLALLAASLTRAGHTVEVIDAIVDGLHIEVPGAGDTVINGLTEEAIIARIAPDTDLIGLSCMFTADWPHTKKLINCIHTALPSVAIIAGGEHITALPQMCLTQCPGLQVCVLGEGEECILDVCAALTDHSPLSEVKGIVCREGSNMVKTARRERIRKLDEIPMPAWEYFPVQTYFREKLSFGVGGKKTLPILATRGCPYICTFCSSPDMWGTRYYMRSVMNTVDEMEYLKETYGVENIDLYDLTAVINRKWMIEFCKEIIRRNLGISWQLPSGTRSEAIDAEVVKYMKMAGCNVVSYAPESGSERILQLIHKKVNLSNMLRSISASNKEGLYVKINIIIGLPDEKHADVWRTLLFILKASWYGAYDMGPNPFHPIPGTALFNTLQSAGALSLDDDHYYEALLDADNLWKVTFYNKNISPLALKAYFFLSFAVFYFSNFLFRPQRIWSTIRNVMTFNAQTRGQFVLQRILEQNRFLQALRSSHSPRQRVPSRS